MTLYFFNSYQQSPRGFQLSQLEAGDSQLELTDMQNIRSEEFRSLMNSSGAFCTIGFVKNTHYLVFRNISVIDADSRKWYITLGVTSEKSEEQFVRLLQKLLGTESMAGAIALQTPIKNFISMSFVRSQLEKLISIKMVGRFISHTLVLLQE